MDKKNTQITERIPRTILEKQTGELNVLVVDDDPSIVKLIQIALSRDEFRSVNGIDNGKECMEIIGIKKDGTAAEKEPGTYPDLIILDVVLPDISGFDVCRRIKMIKPDIPIILLSGYDLQEVNTMVTESGADDFMTKPFTPMELVTRVRLTIERAKKLLLSKTKKFVVKPQQYVSGIPYIGDRIDEFIVLDFLNWGKITMIYKVINPVVNSLFVLKMIMTHVKNLTEGVKRLENEIEALSSLSHQNIIKFVKKGVFNNYPYFVMEYVDGIDLEGFLITRGKPSLQELCHISHDLAAAMETVHKEGIIHRDIKLKNILYEYKTKSIKITDFGIAKMLDSASQTRDGFVMGTPLYIAPELLYGEYASFSSDIYSYGATIYHFVTGTPPITAEDNRRLFEKLKTEMPSPISKFRSDIPEWFSDLIVGKCLAKDPDTRPKSFAEIKDCIKSNSDHETKKIWLENGI
jgi:CheY-like chemotaxis protein